MLRPLVMWLMHLFFVHLLIVSILIDVVVPDPIVVLCCSQVEVTHTIVAAHRDDDHFSLGISAAARQFFALDQLLDLLIRHTLHLFRYCHWVASA